jgi:hydrogenase maturation protease
LNALNRFSLRFQSLQKSQPALEVASFSSKAGQPRPRTIQTLIIGVGNEFRGDDAVGICVARRLAALRLPNVRVIEQTGEGTDLIEALESAEFVYVVDAVSSKGLVGSIYRFEAQEQTLPAKYFGVSSHAFGVAEAIEIARSLGQLPPKLVVYGIEANNFELGSSLSPPVRQAAENVIRQLLQEVGVL